MLELERGRENWVLPSFTEFYWVLLGYTVKVIFFGEAILQYSVKLGNNSVEHARTGKRPRKLGFTEFYWVLLGFTGFFRAALQSLH